MAWTEPQYGKRQVNEAGVHLIKGESLDHAIEVIDNFRVAHAFPLNTIQINLRRHATNIDEQSIIAQRLKRISSIFLKLQRFPNMRLWDMQDIGGCRAIVHNINEVEQIVNTIKSSSIRHKLAHEDDYIRKPKDSGYRGWHLIYRYFSDRNDVYNGLKIEIQVRTIIQHYWATAVETVDAFTKQALKASRGSPHWERFFQLMGTEMAFREGTPLVPNTPVNRIKLLKKLRECAEELKVQNTLRAFTTALKVPEFVTDSKYFLLSLNANTERLSISGYSSKELKQASEDYAKIERDIRGQKEGDAVLVSVDAMHNLQRAYPNYFADTSKFLEILDDSLRQYLL